MNGIGSCYGIKVFGACGGTCFSGALTLYTGKRFFDDVWLSLEFPCL